MGSMGRKTFLPNDCGRDKLRGSQYPVDRRGQRRCSYEHMDIQERLWQSEQRRILGRSLRMLELLKILVEAALKLLDPAAIEKLRHEGKQRELGTALFRLYIDLVDLVIQGERLIELVQRVVEHKSLIRYSANWRGQYGDNLRIAVERQAAVVEKFSATFASLFGPLVAVDSEAAEVIARVMGVKGTFLDNVAKTLLWRGHLPVEVAKDEDSLLQAEHLRLTTDNIFTEFLPVLDEWSDEHYEQAQLYLNAASHHLIQLKESASKLRASLETYFSLKDVLPELRHDDRRVVFHIQKPEKGGTEQ